MAKFINDGKGKYVLEGVISNDGLGIKIKGVGSVFLSNLLEEHLGKEVKITMSVKPKGAKHE